MTASPETAQDRRWMRVALALGQRGLGRVAPNPAVGCVLVKDGHAVGRGWTQPGGRPHAETEALRRAGAAAKGATAYVSLEPCSHTGKTGPCSTALIEAGVERVVVAMIDPDSRVAGGGIAALEAAGISVTVGVLEREAQRLNHGFILSRMQHRPMVTLKLATTLDGKIATASGESRWITGPEARLDAHLLRMTHDAILVGIGTALVDDPALTCRLPGIEIQSLRVVLDGQGRLPQSAKLCDGTVPTLQIVAQDCVSTAPKGVTRLAVPRDENGLCVSAILSALADRGITRVMVEGGGQIAASFLRADYVDQIVWYRAGLVLGADARPGIGDLSISALVDAARFDPVSSRALGLDRVDRFLKKL
ncbi:MAG: bifunctional diaminohydroxyphosphoribosylaminopyrimidine deaminase/5-amino-6-(5-phosphoribosylamino)uracil reductase RibD [Alphaproteobacteria bacterium]|nr:bifunctional diaminohydroxyphosphoribosylaminopyrimidine deaminase/5-amino-6-(5-phosphoribosylamino)uracil reductase RibD [Alphaproteobacteria bacterium]